MKATGVIRKIDELGRIVVPKEIRKKLTIANEDPVEIYVEGDKIILKKYEENCLFCEKSDALFEFRGKKVCAACLKELKEQLI